MNDLMQRILQSISEGYWTPPEGYVEPEKEKKKRTYLPIIPGAGLKQLFGSDISGSELLRPVQRADFSAQDEEESRKKEAQAAAKKLMDEARASDEFIRSVDYEPSAEFSDPSKGIIVGDISAEKLKKIRDQAAAKFPGATGGNFVSAEMTPEVAARLAENERWLAGQELRDAASRLNNRRTNPVEAAQALYQIAGEQRRLNDQQNRDALLGALSKGGKIPWNDVMAYQENGLNVPSSMIGMSPDDAQQMATVLMQQAQDDIGSSLSSVAVMQDPSLYLKGEFARKLAPTIAEFSQNIKRIGPEAAKEKFWDDYLRIKSEFLASNPGAKYLAENPQEGLGTQIKDINRGAEKP